MIQRLFLPLQPLRSESGEAHAALNHCSVVVVLICCPIQNVMSHYGSRVVVMGRGGCKGGGGLGSLRH